MRDKALFPLTAAVRRADEELTGPIVVPPFERLLRRLPADGGRPPLAPAAPPLWAAWRIAPSLTAAQARLISRSLGPLTVCGLALAVAVAHRVARPDAAAALFSALVALCVLVSATAALTARQDPRRELLATLPVSPAVVCGARLALILALDLSLATAASAVLAGTSHNIQFATVVTGWLGRALLASGAGVFVSVWKSAPAGTAAGLALWLLGWAPGPVGQAVTGTHPWTVAAAAVLLCLAVTLARYPVVTAGGDGA